MSDTPQERFADETEVTLSQLMTPETVNFSGVVHGGHLLRLLDQAAYVCARRYAGTGCRMAALEEASFLAPIQVGDVLVAVARVLRVGTRSLDVAVDLYAEDVQTGKRRHAATGLLVMVAIAGENPQSVPRLVCRTPEDRRRLLLALRRRRRHREVREDLAALKAECAAADDAALDEMLARETERGNG